MRISMLLVLLAVPMFATSAAVGAAETNRLPEPPPPPPGYHGDSGLAGGERDNSAPRNDENVEPDITITTRGTDRIEEYRYNGRLYMIKITPKHGIPYYLIDEQGHGQFKRSDLQPDVKPPMWVLKRF